VSYIKTKKEIEHLRKGGDILARILRMLSEYSKPGISTEDINEYALELVKEYNVEPVLLGYHPEFAQRPYPAVLCTSVNDTVQHGVPRTDEILKDGDIINLDMSIAYEGMIVDSGVTIPVGNRIDSESQRLIAVTKEALRRGIKQAQPGNHIGDIGYAIQEYVEAHGFSVVKVLCGHGVGHAVHEEPQIPNFGIKGDGYVIRVGNVFAIEPIVNIGSEEVVFDDEGDGYSVHTQDGSRSAHFEHTVAITEHGPEIMTKEV
jgi:methionyl aminopeptidase